MATSSTVVWEGAATPAAPRMYGEAVIGSTARVRVSPHMYAQPANHPYRGPISSRDQA